MPPMSAGGLSEVRLARMRSAMADRHPGSQFAPFPVIAGLVRAIQV
jgi:hypothetical protein